MTSRQTKATPRALARIARDLRSSTNSLSFAPPVTHVYQPLDYAWSLHRQYLEQCGPGSKEVLLVGMNPGPFGMSQTGVPFGDVVMVRDWIGISGKVRRPSPEHPKRRIEGLNCTRREVSGTRLWEWAADRFKKPETFFKRFFIWNYCPLTFMEDTGRNRTPDKLPKEERAALFEMCDEALAKTIRTLNPKHVVGIGKFAEARVIRVCADWGLEESVKISVAPHPSPASPAANRGWVPIFEAALKEAGVPLE